MIFIQNHPLIVSLLFSVGLNLFFFFFAALFKTDKVTDISYSLSFFLLVPLLVVPSLRVPSWEQLVVAVSILVWSARLGGYLLYRIVKIGQDHRFDDRREKFIEFLKFWLLQMLAVWVIMLPFSLFLTADKPVVWPWTTGAGLAVFLAGWSIEAVSDHQKFMYKSDPAHSGHWMDRGLWRYSRHPNYFGEILVWWGLFTVVAPSLKGFQWFTVLGPVTITLLLLFVSGIPLLEKSADVRFGKNPEYREYRRRTSLLIPWPLKKPEGRR
jgi:steroid 5-alpha reductase family enzyme